MTCTQRNSIPGIVNGSRSSMCANPPRNRVLDHQESTRLQDGLVTRAQALGWAADRILVIDDDLGKSATSAQGRAGFQRLVSEVSLDHVGMIFGVEISRLARSNKDWHQLLELCALFHTLIADLDGIYDPVQYNDRLLLGLYVRYHQRPLSWARLAHPDTLSPSK